MGIKKISGNIKGKIMCGNNEVKVGMKSWLKLDICLNEQRWEWRNSDGNKVVIVGMK